MGFGGSRHCLGTLFGDVSGFAAEQAEVLFKTALSLCLCELAVFTELRGKVVVRFLLVSIATTSVSITGVTGVTGVTLSAIIIYFYRHSEWCLFFCCPSLYH